MLATVIEGDQKAPFSIAITIQEPSWLPRYRHLVFPWFVSFRQTTHECKTPSWLKDSGIIHKRLEQATPSFPLFHPWNSNLKILATTGLQQFHGMVNSSIEFLLCRLPKTICNTTWMNLCPNLASAHDSKGLLKSFTVRGSWRPNRTATYSPPLLWP